MSRRPGPSKRGPDLSWQDDEPLPLDPLTGKPRKASPGPDDNIPGPLYPPAHFRMPKPLTAREKDSAKAWLDFRARCRRGPLFANLDRSMFVDEDEGMPGAKGKGTKGGGSVRKGFDPFDGQEKWSSGPNMTTTNGMTDDVRESGDLKRRKRNEPDLKTRGAFCGFTLKLFPHELWGQLDPDRWMDGWQNLGDNDPAWASAGVKRGKVESTKRKRTAAARKREEFERRVGGEEGEKSADEESEDDIVGGADRKRRAKAAKTRKDGQPSKVEKQKKGLDAEDDYPDVEPDGEGDEGEEGEEAPVDSDFEESDDGEGDDYNAEQYFDDGGEDEGDDGGGFGGDDDGAF